MCEQTTKWGKLREKYQIVARRCSPNYKRIPITLWKPQPNKREHWTHTLTHVSNRLNAPFSVATCHIIGTVFCRLANDIRFVDNLIYLPSATFCYVLFGERVFVNVSVVISSCHKMRPKNCYQLSVDLLLCISHYWASLVSLSFDPSDKNKIPKKQLILLDVGFIFSSVRCG